MDPEAFAELAKNWRALRRRGEETNTLPFFLPGYRETMARAAALSMFEDLPPDMRRLVDGMLAEHETRLTRHREIGNLTEKIRESWRRWPEIGWAARARGCAVDELPRFAVWRDEGAALLEEARETLGADDEARSHLRAMPGGFAELAGAVETLERTRVMDDSDRFGRLWGELRERAARGGVPESLLPGYREAAALGRRLLQADGLDAARRAPVAEWAAAHETQTMLAEEVHALPGRVAACRERRNDLPLDGHGGADPAHAACRAWREEWRGWGSSASPCAAPGTPHAPWLDAVPARRRRWSGRPRRCATRWRRTITRGSPG